MSEIQLYDKENITQIDWPNSAEVETIKKWWTPLIENGISHYIENIEADPFLLKYKDKVIPVLVTSENYSNSWVCSPFAQYISFSKETLKTISNPWIGRFLNKVVDGFGSVSKFSKMNSIVYVNNWLFSTDLYLSEFDQESLSTITNFLKTKYPRHVIAFRSLNQLTTGKLIEDLNKNGFRMLASRYVFITDGKNEDVFKTRIVKSDLKLIKDSDYKIEQETNIGECEKLLELHHKLYVIDHSELQPQYNKHFFAHLIKNGLMSFKVIKKENVIKGIAGFYRRENVMMCPLFGYDKNTEESNTIYRLLNTALLLEAKEQQVKFNQSAGAAFFKSVRRAEGAQEYIALYTKHTPKRQKYFWNTLLFFINSFGPKYMKKY